MIADRCAGTSSLRRSRLERTRSRSVRLGLAGMIAVGALFTFFASTAGAQDTAPSEAAALGVQVNLLWVVIGAVLVIFMQAGFALVETGFCRAKHAAHVVSTNFIIFGLGFVGYFLVGYAFMFGGYTAPLIGMDNPVGGSFIGSGNWIFLFKGGWALS